MHCVTLTGALQVSVDDFEVVKAVSRGAYGRLYLARLKASGELFAIKVLRKRDLVHKNAVHTIKTERNILAMARNPFVVRFYYSFDTTTHLFVVRSPFLLRSSVPILTHQPCSHRLCTGDGVVPWG